MQHHDLFPDTVHSDMRLSLIALAQLGNRRVIDPRCQTRRRHEQSVRRNASRLSKLMKRLMPPVDLGSCSGSDQIRLTTRDINRNEPHRDAADDRGRNATDENLSLIGKADRQAIAVPDRKRREHRRRGGFKHP